MKDFMAYRDDGHTAMTSYFGGGLYFNMVWTDASGEDEGVCIWVRFSALGSSEGMYFYDSFGDHKAF